MQELFHLLRECSSSYDDLDKLSAKSIGNLLADSLIKFLVDAWHTEQETYLWILKFWKHFLLDNLLNDKRH